MNVHHVIPELHEHANHVIPELLISSHLFPGLHEKINHVIIIIRKK